MEYPPRLRSGILPKVRMARAIVDEVSPSESRTESASVVRPSPLTASLLTFVAALGLSAAGYLAMSSHTRGGVPDVLDLQQLVSDCARAEVGDHGTVRMITNAMIAATAACVESRGDYSCDLVVGACRGYGTSWSILTELARHIDTARG